MTRMTPASLRPAGDCPGELPGVGRRGVHLPVRGHDHVTHGADHARATGVGDKGPSASSASLKGKPLEAFQRALDGGPVKLQAAGQLGERRLGRLPARRGDRPDDPRLGGEPAVGLEPVDRIELPARGRDRPLEVRRLGIEHAVQLTAERARDLPCLELQQAQPPRRSGAGTSPPPRRSSTSRRPGRGAAARRRAAQVPRGDPRDRAPRREPR